MAWATETPVSELDDTSLLDALRKNFSRGRVDAVVKIFEAYGKQSPASNAPSSPPTMAQAGPQPGRQPPAPPAAPYHGAAAPVDLATLAGPGAPQEPGADPLAKRPQHIWSGSDIQQFYADKMRGRLTPEQARATEAELQRAMAEGRYKP